jgi:hypothetical protein
MRFMDTGKVAGMREGGWIESDILCGKHHGYNVAHTTRFSLCGRIEKPWLSWVDSM